MPHPRCPSSPSTSVKRTGAPSPRGVSSSRTSKPPRLRTSSSSSPSPSPSTRESSLVTLFFRLPCRWKEDIEFVPVATSLLGRGKSDETTTKTSTQHQRIRILSLSLSLSLCLCPSFALRNDGSQRYLFITFMFFLLHFVSRSYAPFLLSSLRPI